MALNEALKKLTSLRRIEAEMNRCWGIASKHTTWAHSSVQNEVDEYYSKWLKAKTEADAIEAAIKSGCYK